MKKLMMIVAMIGVIGMAGVADAGTALWLKADAIQGLSDGQTVPTWNDSSGNGNNATGVNTPSYETGEFNAGTMPGVYFDGSTDYFNIAHSSSINVTSHTLFVVTKTETTADRGYFLTKVGDPVNYAVESGKEASGILSCGVNDGAGEYGYRLSAATHDNATGIVMHRKDVSSTDYTTAFNMYWNGSPDNGVGDHPSGATGSYTNTEPMRVGVVSYDGGATFTRYHKGFMGEVILFDTLLTTTEINDVNAYLGDKWGITVAGNGDPDAGRALLPPDAGGEVIPEPAGLGLIGLALLAVRRRRS